MHSVHTEIIKLIWIAPKLPYSNVEFQNFLGDDPGPPAPRRGDTRRRHGRKPSMSEFKCERYVTKFQF
jgi:hypothetical protein